MLLNIKTNLFLHLCLFGARYKLSFGTFPFISNDFGKRYSLNTMYSHIAGVKASLKIDSLGKSLQKDMFISVNLEISHFVMLSLYLTALQNV